MDADTPIRPASIRRRRSAGFDPPAETIVANPLDGTVRRTVLPNGLRIVTEAIPAMRSVSFGV